MWPFVPIAVLTDIQHRRIQGAAVPLFGVRLLEGAACWAILYGFYSGVTVSAWAVHLTFAGYALSNLALFFLHRRMGMTPARLWLDIAANLAPMAGAAYWSGGLYSPLIPVFVVKIMSYTTFYGVGVGWQSLGATLILAIAVLVAEHSGLGRSHLVETVPYAAREHLHLAFELLAFGILVGAGLKILRILRDHEHRLKLTVKEKDHLYQTSLEQQAHLRHLSRGMMRVSERTMGRLARELHDDLGQALTAVKMDLGLIEHQLNGHSETRSRLRAARDQIGVVLQGVRNLSQMLRPAALDDLGLLPAMKSYIGRFSQRTRIPIEFEAPEAGTRLPRAVEVALYRVLQEALTNVARHAHARHVSVGLELSSDVARLHIVDDGCGFDAATFLCSPPEEHGMGVIGIRERVATYGGLFALESARGAGTRVEVSIPLTEPIEDSEDDHGQDPSLVG